MAKGPKRGCNQCGEDHHGFSETCWRCERQNAENAKPTRICPYCLAEKDKSLPSSPYHTACSFYVNDISRRATAQVKRAIKHGLIPAISHDTKCVDCGNPARDYEHRYYTRPLDVEPVCRGCNQRRGPALDVHEFYLASTQKAA